jgi:hypothetical protein
VLYGYYIDEIRLAKKDPEVADVAIPYIGERVKFVVINPKRERRQIVARSLGCHAMVRVSPTL